MTPPPIEQSTQEARRAYVLDAWKCLHDCESCGKCRILKGKDAETLYADYIEGKRSYGRDTGAPEQELLNFPEGGDIPINHFVQRSFF